jgi:hypothetical protein
VVGCGIMVGLIVCRGWNFTFFGKLMVGKAKDKWRVLLVMRVLLHGVVNFYGCRLLRGFHRVLIYFLL